MKLLRKKQQVPARRSGLVVREGRANANSLDERYAFRRNRTLTGSLSSNVSSASESFNELRSARVQAHDLRRHRRKLFGVWLGVSVVTLLLGYLLYESIALPNVRFREAVVVQPENKSLYEKKIQEYLNAHFFERSRLTLNVKNLAIYLQTHGAPEVEEVSSSLSFGGLGVSTISLKVRKPVVSWKTGDVRLYVDQKGIGFEKNYYDAPTVSVLDQTGVQTRNNRILASNRFLSFMGRLIGRLAEQGYRATQVVLPEGTTRQLLMSVDGVPYPIKFSVDRPAAAQAEDAAQSIRYLLASGISPTYLDVRVSGKAYYK